MYPSDRRYTKDHEWVIVSGSQGRVGITDYAQKQLGDVVFVELPEVNRTVTQGQSCGTIESVKAVSDVVSPLSGEVLEVNAKAVDEPEVVNDDPYGAGWLIRIRMSDAAELDLLMDAAAYRAHVADQ